MKTRKRRLLRAAAARVGAKAVQQQRLGRDLAAPAVVEPRLCVCARLLPLLSVPECGHVSGSREVLLQLQEVLSQHRPKQILQALHQLHCCVEQHIPGKKIKQAKNPS